MNVLQIMSLLYAQLPQIVMAVNGLLLALIAVFILVPGDHPEKELQAIVDFIAKLSR